MSDFLKSVEQLQAQYETRLPPVDSWNPELSGDLDMRIDRSGEWFYQGDPIGRYALKKLFAGILKREGDDYFLVTPVEKWRIEVEDAPLVVTKCEFSHATVDGSAQSQPIIMLTTNMDDQFIVDKEHPLWVEERNSQRASAEPDLAPYATVRRNIPALINRNVYYELVEQALSEGENESANVFSAGEIYSLLP
ncbi:DUF1285 domain-containing protein [Aurantivibrio plasticivorans]